MKQTPTQALQPVGKTRYREYVVWSIMLSALLITAMLQAFRASWYGEALPAGPMLLAASVGTAGCILGRRLQKKNSLAALLWLLPWVPMPFLMGVAAPWRGAQWWLNGLITRWNLVHEGGTALFRVTAVQRDVNAFAVVVCVFCSQLVWWLVANRRIFLVGVSCFAWLFVMFLGSCYDPLACALLLASVLCISMSAPKVPLTGHTVVMSAVLTAVLAACAVMLPQGELARVRTLRENLQEGVYTARYGERTLPEGDLYEASRLQSSDAEMLTVETQQEKSFYLRAFVGSSYENGIWQPLPDAAFGGDNAGMLQWLAEQGFDPLTQSADYWRLDENTPEANRMSIRVLGASRYYFYAPVSMGSDTAHAVNGEELRTRGLLGWDRYSYEELSDFRPAELMVASSWVTEPRTDEQRRYSEAEAVYRRFVYANYTAQDADMNALMQSFFWNDYDTEADGIYSAVDHIRTVLKRQVSYDENAADVPTDRDPVQYFLTESRRGNSALYAAATVQALRAKGIPARYVEGYYLPSADVGTGTVTLTGRDAHAWAEAYFDGIGWLPLDTVPGCYYEAVALQQMVGLPDAVRKTAALQDNDSEAAQITGEDGSGDTDRTPLETAANVLMVTLGAVAVLMMVLAVAIAAAEVMRGLRYRLAVRSYRKAQPTRRAALVERYLYRMLHIYGIDASLGWNTAEMDALIAKQFIDIEPGEYARVCSLLEKTTYGGEAPDLREERAMQSFLQKLAASGREEPLHRRLRLRYTCP